MYVTHTHTHRKANLAKCVGIQMVFMESCEYRRGIFVVIFYFLQRLYRGGDYQINSLCDLKRFINFIVSHELQCIL